MAVDDVEGTGSTNLPSWDENGNYEIDPKFLAKLSKDSTLTPIPPPKEWVDTFEATNPTTEDRAEFRKERVEQTALFALDDIFKRCNNRTGATPAAIFANPFFDPNAKFILYHEDSDMRIGIKKERREKERYSIVGLLFGQEVTEKEFVDFLHKKEGTVLPDALTTAYGRTFTDINTSLGGMAPPLVNSILHKGWNIHALLAHPQIDPNIDISKIKCDGYVVLSELDRGKFFARPMWHDEVVHTPLERLCLQLSRDFHKGTSVVVEPVLMRQHYIDAISGMIDAGAIVTPTAAEICNQETALKHKIETIRKRQDDLAKGKATDITATDIKQAYALGGMGKLFSAATDNQQNLLGLQDKLPKWLRAEMKPMFSALEHSDVSTDWTTRIGKRRADVMQDKGIKS